MQLSDFPELCLSLLHRATLSSLHIVQRVEEELVELVVHPWVEMHAVYKDSGPGSKVQQAGDQHRHEQLEV